MIFINQETGPLLIDMINVFAKKNIEVKLYTGQVIKTSVDLNKNVQIRKLCTYKKNSNILRLITWIIFFFQTLFFLIRDLDKKTEMWISTNPPFAPWLVLFFKNTSYIHVYDVYPNALLALSSVTKKSLIYKIFLFLNRKSFTKSKYIFTPSVGMKNMLLDSSDAKKIEVISWWADTEFIKPIQRADNNFLSYHGLNNNFVIMYSGNLGLTHNIEKLLYAANELEKYENIKIVIIGDGAKKKIVDDFLKVHKSKNLLVLPFQDEKILPYSLAACDLAVVFDSFASGKEIETTASIPSKTYYLMAAGSVIYAEADKSSELNRLISNYDIGLCDDSKDVNGLISFIERCVSNEKLLKKYKENSRKASSDFTSENAKLLFQKINGNSDEDISL